MTTRPSVVYRELECRDGTRNSEISNRPHFPNQEPRSTLHRMQQSCGELKSSPWTSGGTQDDAAARRHGPTTTFAAAGLLVPAIIFAC